MFVPRSFSYSSGKRTKDTTDEKSALKESNYNGSEVHRGFGWRPESFHRERGQQKSTREITRARSLEGLTSTRSESTTEHAQNIASETAHLPVPSQPVAVPSRPSSRHQQSTQSSSASPGRSQHLQSSSSRRNLKPTPPAVAALLATTSIPKPKSYPRSRPHAAPRKISIDEVVDQWKHTEFQTGTPPGISPAMDTLLSPPEEIGDALSQVDEQEMATSSRTTSSESMPSLEPDSSSGLSSNAPPTPEAGIRGKRRRKQSTSIPRSVDTSSEHPLSLPSLAEHPDIEPEWGEMAPQRLNSTPATSRSRTSSLSRSTSRSNFLRQRDLSPRRTSSRPSSFKSNLTASLSNLKNNISRTFSNFSAPSTSSSMSSEQIAKSLLGTPYHPEMRPRPMTGTPTAQMRRYMNPHAFRLYDFHLHNSHIDDADLEAIAAANAANAEARATGDPNAPAAPEVDVIPLDTYEGQLPTPRRGAATEAGRAMELAEGKGQQQQRREPRENSEFLRIAVLELQMRRAGKVEGPIGGGPLGLASGNGMQSGSGRRGWFLPPRGDNVAFESCASREEPGRWGEVWT